MPLILALYKLIFVAYLKWFYINIFNSRSLFPLSILILCKFKVYFSNKGKIKKRSVSLMKMFIKAIIHIKKKLMHLNCKE